MAGEKTSTRLVGKAALTLVRTLDKRVAYVYRGKPAPSNISKDERDRLVGGGFLSEEKIVVDEGTDAAGDGPAPGGSGAGLQDAGAFDVATLGTPGATKDATLAWVAGDKARAARALKAEQDRPVDEQRSTLVTALEKIAEPDA